MSLDSRVDDVGTSIDSPYLRPAVNPPGGLVPYAQGRRPQVEIYTWPRRDFQNAPLLLVALRHFSRGLLMSEPASRAIYLFGRRDGRLPLTLHTPPDTESRRFGAALAEVGRAIVVGDPYGSPVTDPQAPRVRAPPSSRVFAAANGSTANIRATAASGHGARRLEVVTRRSTTLTR